MTRKIRFGVPANIKQSLSETIHMVEDYSGIYTNTLIPIDKIVFDPENPRKLHLKKTDLPQGPLKQDPYYKEKSIEFESLSQLANSIKNEGIIHPVVLYKNNGQYILVAGERRCLASIIAQKRTIEARVFNDKPNSFKLKLIQWAENNAREDLTLYQRIMNMRDIIEAYKKQSGKENISAMELSEITNLSRPQATYYMQVIQASSDLLQSIADGKINNLDKAATIAKVTNEKAQKSAILACEKGLSLAEIRKLIIKAELKKTIDFTVRKVDKTRPGRQATRVYLGFTKQTKVAKFIFETIHAHPLFQNSQYSLAPIDWNNLLQVNQAMKELMADIEEKIGHRKND